MTPDMARRASAPAKVHRLRRATEVLLAPWVLKRRLPALAGGGLIVVSAKVGGLKFLIKPADRWDPNLLNIAALLVRNGNVVWDIGANVGLFSRAASFHAGDAGTVLAVEADLDAVALLNRMRTHIASGHAAIEVLPVAVSKVCGFVHFDIAMRARATNAISGYGSTQTGGVKETRTLPAVTLDYMLTHFRAPNVLKIDVEGAEVDVLFGASQLLDSSRPFVYCEVQGNTRSAVMEILEGYDYRLWDGDRFNGTPHTAPVTASTSNILAAPKEKCHALLDFGGAHA